MNNKLAIILALAGLVISGWASAQSSAAVQVKRASWASSAEYEGQVEAVTDTRVAAQVAGSIKQVHVRAGDVVTAGQLLIEIDASQARQQQAAAQAQAHLRSGRSSERPRIETRTTAMVAYTSTSSGRSSERPRIET